MNPRDLPIDRLSTTDESGKRVYVYPADYRGRWKRRRSWVSMILGLIFLILPWVRIGGQQALLLDVIGRRFAIFGLTFWAHDLPMLFLVVVGAILTIALLTVVFGRIWCGWGCPQTVFVEQVFRRVERLIEGNALERKKLDESELGPAKAFLKTLKWGVFLLLALVISHSFLAYFVGTQALARMMAVSPTENPGTFLVMAGVTLAVLFDFGWFREQFCTVVCPYGRFQSVLMDSRSTVVAYDTRRGEPRKLSVPSTPVGDCVNCYRCVQVCPTGIDIRRGVQLECVACTACIDACDEVMSRLEKAPGLIRYGTQAELDPLVGSDSASNHGVRVAVCAALVFICGSTLSYLASHRAPIEFSLIRAVDVPYQELPDGFILNHFKADLRNQTFDPQEISFALEKTGARGEGRLVVSNHARVLSAGEPERADLFFQIPRAWFTEGRASAWLEVIARAPSGKIERQRMEARLVGPLR